MRTVLVVQNAPDGLVDVASLEDAGYLVRRCFGGQTTFAACPMLRKGDCPLPAGADVIVFAPGLFDVPVAHRTYRMIHVLRGYRRHPAYARLPMLVLADALPPKLGGSGPVWLLDPNTPSEELLRVLDAVAEGASPDAAGSLARLQQAPAMP